MSRRCSHCGHNGHNSRTCLDKGFKLFGVRLTDSCSPSSSVMRKSVSLGNLSSYGCSDAGTSPSASPLEQPELGDSLEGYASDDLVHASSSARQRKKGVPWTEDEHRSFLLGLQKLGKGDWRGISRNFVKTRTPTQVASHAQKYFLRRNNLNKRRRRSSLFDITPDAVSTLLEESLMEEPIFEEADVCPVAHELSLGHNPTHGDGRNRDVSILPRHAYPIGGFPLRLPPLSLTCMPISVPEIREEASDAGESEGLEDCEMTEVADEASSQQPTLTPTKESVPEANGNAGRESSHISFPFPLFPMWPGPVVQCVEKRATWFSDSKILKPTPILPTLPLAVDDTVKLSKLSLSNSRPVMEPTPLSYKLLEEGSRHSAFHTTTSSSGELDPQGNLSNAISVP